ncbi:MAG: HTH-type transcriptional regulator GlnR [Pelotomaculum sp. PtaB.Bin104]|nr:MAG: HTH-type transcriptional regulator GlnR [Pelotomaculum sp. PtaB.Bin104]
MTTWDDDKPALSIGIIAQFLQVHPETLRIWERNGLIQPARKNKQRLYSNNDLKRLKFIHHLINEKGLNIAGVQQVLAMYSCWKNRSCQDSQIMNKDESMNKSKPCWKKEGYFCTVIQDQADLCSNCKFYQEGCRNTD